MARRFGLLLLSLSACPSGCLYPWDHGSTTTGESTGTTSQVDGSSSSEGSSTTADDTTMGPGSGSQGSASASTGHTTGPDTTGGTTLDTTAATTGPAPECGDGAVNSPDEECDDGNDDPDDGCDLACARDRLIFTTSESFSAKLVGGLALADGICRQFAGKAGLPNWKTYTAWLSDSKTDAIDRVHHGRGRYRRPDGALVAESFDTLLAGPLLAPLAIDENGNAVVDGVWTGTRPDGTAVPGAWHCNDWTSDAVLELGHFGFVEVVDGRWTFIPDPEVNPTNCIASLHLYCFEGK